MRRIYDEKVEGIAIDEQTRCEHYHSELDIIAIKFKCCDRWFPCFKCHAAIAGHAAAVWPTEEFARQAVLCGSCGHQLTVSEYLHSGSVCTSCGSRFNPGCAAHYHLYFEKAER